MEEKRISIVVPVYNAERYLDACVESIVGQTYGNLEIILVDDGSPDGCPQMCDEWAKRDDRIKVIHKVNEGAGIARDVGLSHVTGEYVCFFDSDDWIAPDTIEKAVTVAQTESADLVVFGMNDPNRADSSAHAAALTSQKPVFAGEEVQRVFLPDLIENGYVGAGNTGFALSLCVCLFSMELIRRADWHIVSEREYASEDSYSILKLYGSVNRVAVLPERLYHYRLNDVSLSHTYREDGHRRMRKFYQNSVGLAKQMGYSPEVSKRLAGLYFSQVIGILKQLASTDLDRRQKMNLFREITADPVLQEALAQIDWQYASGAKQVLLHCMRSRRYRWVYGLTALQIRRSKQKHPRHRSCSF